MKIICIGTTKGGVGKTTLTFNLAGLLAKMGKVLIWDIDPQANLSCNTGVNIMHPNIKTTKDILEKNTSPQEVVIKSPIKELENLDIISSNLGLHETEMLLVNRSAREFIIKYYIEDNIDFFEQYDWILIDTNPGMTVINQNGFLVADSIILVSDISDNAAQGVEQFQYMWHNRLKDFRMKDNIKALIINNFDKRTSLSNELVEYYKNNEDLTNLLIKTVIPSRVKMKETALEHKPINILDPSCDANLAIQKIANELKERGIL